MTPGRVRAHTSCFSFARAGWTARQTQTRTNANNRGERIDNLQRSGGSPETTSAPGEWRQTSVSEARGSDALTDEVADRGDDLDGCDATADLQRVIATFDTPQGGSWKA